MLTKTRNSKIDVLRDVPLFKSCTEKELTKIASLVDEIEMPAGRTLAVEGRPGRECFVIADGEAVVTLHGDEIARLGPGDVFGEMALIDHGPRSATVRAESPMRLFVLDPRNFSTLLARHRNVARKVLQAVVERLRTTEDAPTW
jgi:CRP/FNR family transcriptional regulator, cyclic AMP receptor protein